METSNTWSFTNHVTFFRLVFPTFLQDHQTLEQNEYMAVKVHSWAGGQRGHQVTPARRSVMIYDIIHTIHPPFLCALLIGH